MSLNQEINVLNSTHALQRVHFTLRQQKRQRGEESDKKGDGILVIYDNCFPKEQLWTILSVLERFETSAVSAFLDVKLAVKENTSSLKRQSAKQLVDDNDLYIASFKLLKRF